MPVFSCFSTNDLEEEDPDLTSSVLFYWVAGFLSSFVTVHVSIKNGFSWLIYLYSLTHVEQIFEEYSLHLHRVLSLS